MAAVSSTDSSLLAAVEAGDEAAVARLLATNGVDCNQRRNPLCPSWNQIDVGSLGPTALMLAMRSGHDGVAKALLAAKADPWLLDQFGKTAAMHALEYGHAHMESLITIISKMSAADVAQMDKWGHNLIMYAALAGSAEIVARLLAQDASGVALKARVPRGEHDMDTHALGQARAGRGHRGAVEDRRAPLVLEASRQISSAGAQAPRADARSARHQRSAHPRLRDWQLDRPAERCREPRVR